MTGIHPRQGDNPPVEFDLAKGRRPRQRGGAGAGAAAPPKEEGMTKEQRAEYEKKLKEQEEAMAKDKALQDAFNAGMEAKNAKNYPVAIENFEKASGMAPTQHVVWAQLAESYISLGDTKTGAEQQADFEKGVAAYAKAVEIKVDDPNYHNNYALALAKDKKMDQAQAELTKAAQLDPPQAGKYYYNLGAVYVNTQQNDAAETAFKKAIELDPNYADAYYQQGLVLMNKVSLDKDGKMAGASGHRGGASEIPGAEARWRKCRRRQGDSGTTGHHRADQLRASRRAKGKQPANQKKIKRSSARHAADLLPGRRGRHLDPAAIGGGSSRQGLLERIVVAVSGFGRARAVRRLRRISR